MKKISLVLLITVLFLVGAMGCSSDSTSEEGISDDIPAEVPSVALLVNGPISDMGWCASAYDALMKIGKEYGAKVSYAESVAQSDMEEIFRGYAAQGYNMIIGHGSQFTDACLVVASEYPDTQFLIINGAEPREPNVTCAQIADDHQGFLMGAFAALMTETNTIGMVGGLELPPITNAVKGFIAGAEYVNPDLNVLTTMTGTFDDAAKTKETALAFIDKGADYVGSVAAAASMGAVEACQDRGIYAIGGAGGDMYDAAPDTVVVSSIKDIAVPIMFAYETYLEGELEAKIYRVGVKEGAVYYSPFHSFDTFVNQDIKDKLDEIVSDLGDGKIGVKDIDY